MHHYAVSLCNPLDEAIEKCRKAMRVLDGSATRQEQYELIQENLLPVKGRTSFIDLTGQKRGPWNVLAYVGKQGKTYPTEWLCENEEGFRDVIDYPKLVSFPMLRKPATNPPPPQNHWV